MRDFLYSWALKVCLLPLKITDQVNSEHSPSAKSWIVTGGTTIVGFIACVLFFSWRLSKKSRDEEKKRKNEDLADEGYQSEDSGKRVKPRREVIEKKGMEQGSRTMGPGNGMVCETPLVVPTVRQSKSASADYFVRYSRISTIK